jgi:hypothetical protein
MTDSAETTTASNSPQPVAGENTTLTHETGTADGADTATSTAAPAEVKPEVFVQLNAIEQLAVYWGGETGTKIRNHVGRIRQLLEG